MASDFGLVNRDYEAENWIDIKTWEKRRIYDNSPYVVLLDQKFNIKLGNLLPSFYCYIKVNGELFGDSITFDLTDYDVKFYLYDSNQNLIVRDVAEVNNATLGEVKYEWKDLDLMKEGFYTAFIECTHKTSNQSFKLPSTSTKLEVIVTK